MRVICEQCGKELIDTQHGQYCSARCKKKGLEFEKLTAHMPRYKDRKGRTTKAGKHYLKWN